MTESIKKHVFYKASKTNIKKYIDERLPEEYEKCLEGLTAILRESWDMSQQPDIDRREKIQALSLAKECYTTKLELLTNATVVKDAITFVSKHLQQHQQQDHGKDKEDKGKIVTINEFETKTILEETEKSEASELDKKESAEATNQVF